MRNPMYTWECLSTNSIQHVLLSFVGEIFWHIYTSSESFQEKKCETSFFQRKVTQRTFICQRQLWDAPYLFFPCLTSSSSFFRICPISIIHNLLNKWHKRWIFDGNSMRLKRLPQIMNVSFAFQLIRKTKCEILDSGTWHTTTLHPDVKFTFFDENRIFPWNI